VISQELIQKGLNSPGFLPQKVQNGNATVTSIRELGPYTDYKKVAKYPEKEVTHG
jgi:hypothetical protein